MAGENIPYMYVAYIVLGITSCTANAILIWIIVRNRNFRTVSNVIIVSLACSDFMLGFFVSPMEMVHHLLPDFKIVGYGCIAHQSLMIFIPLVSIVHLLLVTVERFVKIVYPLHYHTIATKYRTAGFIIVAWTAPLTLSLLPFIGVHGEMTNNFTDPSCGTLDMLPCPYLYTVFGIICVICIIMAVLYSKIVMIALQHAKQIRNSQSNQSKCSLCGGSELRALRVLMMTVLYFVFSWTPFCGSIVEECITKETPNYYTTAVFIAYFNSTINPVIYGIGNRELRNSFFGLLCKRKNNLIAPMPTRVTNVFTAEPKVVETTM